MLPAGTIIQPKSFLILAGNRINFLGEYRRYDASPVVDMGWPRSTVLHNSNSGRVHLIAPGETTPLDVVDYQIGTAPWPSGTPNDSITIELNGPTLDNSLGGNWTYSPAQKGSPGKPNAPLNTGGITITGGVRAIQYPSPTDQLEISVQVSRTGISGVDLFFDTSTASSGYTSVPMVEAPVSSGQFTYNLGAFPDGTLVKYYVQASNVQGFYVTQPYLTPHAFFVDDDFPTDDDLVINEIMYDPTGVDNGASSEWYEIVNLRSTPIDMSFFMWGNHTETPNARVAPEGSIIPGNGYFIFAGNKALFLQQYPSVDPNIVVEAQWEPTSIMSNSLTDANGVDLPLVHANAVDWNDTRVPLDFVPYRAGSPWPVTTEGISIQLIPPPTRDNTVGANWNASSAVGQETPSAPNNTSAVNDWAIY